MIRVQNLACRAGDFRLGEVSFSVRAGEYFVVLGPTGAGKTLLLESIAGLHRNPPQSVWIDGLDVSGWMPEERGIGYVPQDYALFPFLSVKDNILFPVQVRRKWDGQADADFRQIVGLLRIGHLLHRKTQGLSGGERQRVALARALVIRPKLLLFDEPFAALHAGLRRKLWMEMRLLHRQLQTTVIHVTHDLEEAFTLSERAAVLIDGKVEQIGSRNQILQEPVNEKVATFLGIMNLFHGFVAEIDSGARSVCVRSKDYQFHAPLREELSVGDGVGFCILPERIAVLADASGAAPGDDESRLHARLVTAVSQRAARVLYFKLPHSSCRCAEYDLEVRLPLADQAGAGLCEGQEATLVIGKDAVHVFRKQVASFPSGAAE
jgi:ABC-type sugar transport system ATPase subunit